MTPMTEESANIIPVNAWTTIREDTIFCETGTKYSIDRMYVCISLASVTRVLHEKTPTVAVVIVQWLLVEKKRKKKRGKRFGG